MILKTATVSSKGQVAIPRDVREQAGIRQGDELIFLYNNGNLVVKKAEEISRSIETDHKDMLEHLEHTLKKIWDNEDDEHWNGYPRSHKPQAITNGKSS